ncbi:MAG: ribosome small subunit-dependent GTPase A [Planctomycetota bacterium]
MAKKKRFRNAPEQLGELDGNERARLYKKARQQRRATQAPRRRERKRSYDEWLEAGDDAADSGVQKMSQSTSTLDSFVERMLDAPTPQAPPCSGEAGAALEGLVVHVTAQRCQVSIAGGAARRCHIPEWVHESTPIAIGDRVLVQARESCDEDEVVEVLPRQSHLSRPDPMVPGRERIIVANVDVVAVVAALKTPPLRPRLIDRYLVAIEQGGASPLIVVNKTDLVPEAERAANLSVLDPVRKLGVPVVCCSALHAAGMEELRQHLRHKTVAFVGHSGVGKSSIVNALQPELDVDTGAVTNHAGKGTHTTTASTLYSVGGGTLVIDTPGVRSFGLQGLTRDDLRYYFHDFDTRAATCRFADCAHDHEPGCGVRAGVDGGEIAPARYETYLRLLREL